MVSFKFVYPLIWASLSSLKHRALFTSIALTLISTSSAKLKCASINDDNCGENLRKKTQAANNIFNSFKEYLPDDFEKKSAGIVSFFETGIPSQIGYGFLMGYSSGFCLKKLSKVVAFGIGGAFVFIQILSANGYINVEYQKIQKEMESVLDLNKDGKVDSGDVQFGYEKTMKLLGHQIPSGGGFAAGLVAGLRS